MRSSKTHDSNKKDRPGVLIEVAMIVGIVVILMGLGLVLYILLI